MNSCMHTPDADNRQILQADFWTRLWYGRHSMAWILLPLSGVFATLTALRRAAYRWHLIKQHKMPVIVIIIGNLTVGGTGKTPLVIWLAQHLKTRGHQPGIITRGYKGHSRHWPLRVTPDSDTHLCGDEAVLLARRTGCPVQAGPDRVAAAHELLQQNNCDILISDDGLQHYALARDLEIAVLDGTRGCGNGYLLPAGPLREPRSRLQSVNLVVSNGAVLPNAFNMQMLGEELVDVCDPQNRKPLHQLSATRVHAIAAIGNPERFFAHLRRSNIQLSEHSFPDHHAYIPQDLTFPDTLPVLMTEKDAVKCQRFSSLLPKQRFWYLPVQADLPESFAQSIDQQIESIQYGQKTP